jgi:hypothetical protein
VPVCELRPEVPAEVGKVVAKAIEKRREDRHQSARELLGDLAAALGPRWKTVLAWEVAHELSGDGVAAPTDAAVSTIIGAADLALSAGNSAAPPAQVGERAFSTLSRSAGEVAGAQTAFDQVPRKRYGLVAAGIALSVAAAVGAVALLRRSPPAVGQRDEQRAASPALKPADPVGHGKPASAPAAASPKTVHLVRVTADDERVICRARIGSDAVRTQPVPCSFDVPEGRRLELEARRPGFEPFRQTWAVTEARSLHLSTRQGERKITVASGAKPPKPVVTRSPVPSKTTPKPDDKSTKPAPPPIPSKPAEPKPLHNGHPDEL